MSFRPYDGYPDSWGYNRASLIPHAGPASYTVVTVGAPPAVATGGDEVEAVQAGMKLIDFVASGISDSGNYRVDAIAQKESGQFAGVSGTAYTLKWTALRTATIGGQAQTANAEAVAATDLSDEVVRLLVVGPK